MKQHNLFEIYQDRKKIYTKVELEVVLKLTQL